MMNETEIVAPMKIHSITYQRVKNLGNYESERLEMSAEFDEGEDPDTAATAAAQLRMRVNSILATRHDAPSPVDDDIPEDF